MKERRPAADVDPPQANEFFALAASISGTMDRSGCWFVLAQFFT
jgi:hypothetical protein